MSKELEEYYNRTPHIPSERALNIISAAALGGAVLLAATGIVYGAYEAVDTVHDSFIVTDVLPTSSN